MRCCGRKCVHSSWAEYQVSKTCICLRLPPPLLANFCHFDYHGHYSVFRILAKAHFPATFLALHAKFQVLIVKCVIRDCFQSWENLMKTSLWGCSLWAFLSKEPSTLMRSPSSFMDGIHSFFDEWLLLYHLQLGKCNHSSTGLSSFLFKDDAHF